MFGFFKALGFEIPWPRQISAGLLVWLAASHGLLAKVISYDFPEEMPVSSKYTVTVDGASIPAIQTERGAILSFGMTGPVEVVVKLATKPGRVDIRPLSAGITAKVDEKTVRFVVPNPRNLSVEIDGNLDDPLFVFANPEIALPPDRKAAGVRFFEAGKIHDAGTIDLKDGETLFLEGGAVVRGTVRALRAKNVTISGPGILQPPPGLEKFNMFWLRECDGAVLENFILLDPPGWSIHLSGSKNIRMTNTRVIGWRANTDGLDIEYSSKVQVDGCFWRTSDDCIAVKAIYPPGIRVKKFDEGFGPDVIGSGITGNEKDGAMGDITISNCVLWNDKPGQGFEIGFEMRTDSVKGITFRDSDIIHVLGGGAFTIHNGDRAFIEDVLFENIRIENTDRLLDFQVGISIYSEDCPPEYRRSNPQRVVVPKENRPKAANNPYQWYVPAASELPRFEANRGHVRNVVLRNIRLTNAPLTGSILFGYNDKRGIERVTIENLVINGKAVSSAVDMDLFQSDVRDLRFITHEQE